MSLKKATPKAVFEACEQLELLDRPWNRDDIRLTIGGGSFSVIDPLIQAWRKLQPVREVAPSVPTDLLIQVATMLEQQVSGFIAEVENRDQEREQVLLEVNKVVAENLHQIEFELTTQLETFQQTNHDLEAECSRLESELSDSHQTRLALELKTELLEKELEHGRQTIALDRKHTENTLNQYKKNAERELVRMEGQHIQLLAQTKLENDQQLASQKSHLLDAAELAENRLMRLLDQGRSELKETRFSLEGKLGAMQLLQQDDKQALNKQKIEIDALESVLKKVKHNAQQQALTQEANISLAVIENSNLKKQLENQVQQSDKTDIQAIKDSIQLLQDKIIKN